LQSQLTLLIILLIAEASLLRSHSSPKSLETILFCTKGTKIFMMVSRNILRNMGIYNLYKRTNYMGFAYD